MARATQPLFCLGYGCGIAVDAAAPPTLSYATPQSWTYGAAITPVSPTTTGATSFAVQSGSLPTGVSLNTSTGDITGTPTAWAASGSVTIRATGPGGTADSTISWTMAFVPATFGTCVLWLKADGTLWQDSARTTPAVADADPIGAWDDGSGNTNNATQGTSGARPTLKLNIQSGLPVARFDGIDDFLATAGSVTHAMVFAVSKNNSGFGVVVCVSGTNRYFFASFSDGNLYTSDGSTAVSAAATINAYKQMTGRMDASGALRLDGSEIATGTQTTRTGATGIGCRNFDSTPQVFLSGDVCEVVIFSAAISNGNRDSVEAYLKARWGTP